MPTYLFSFLFGKLYLTYLFLLIQVEIPELAEECQLMDLDPEQENRRRRAHHGPAYEEDDEHPGMNRVQCATS